MSRERTRLRAQLLLVAVAYATSTCAVTIVRAVVRVEDAGGVFWSAIAVIALLLAGFGYLTKRFAAKLTPLIGFAAVRALVAAGATLAGLSVWMVDRSVLDEVATVMDVAVLLLIASALVRPVRWERIGAARDA